MFFKQIQQHGDNFSYLIADQNTYEAAVVDSSYNSQEIIKALKAQNLRLKYIINTHGHSDHTTGNTELKLAFKDAKVVAHRQSRTQRDVVVDEGDQLLIGKIRVKILYTPGHTPDGICLLVDNQKLLTGDTLFVGECGRVDLPGGNSKQLYESLFGKLLKLDDCIEVYPGHDYGVKSFSTIGYERQNNYVLKPRTIAEFVAFMSQP
ncbi:MAG: MBL fold metallo-hydrolase [Crenarchaeota archaeon]|jgi:glyoxylase-like metal-dependent hydrolase (beta-lactamase superfamily II)|nr:MBL fold metallo-hydrolase [Thermoproteota archaeon]